MSVSTTHRARRSTRKIPTTIAGLVPAKVLAMLPLLIGFYDPTGKIIATESAIDPRERYCNDYNNFATELGTGIVARPIH